MQVVGFAPHSLATRVNEIFFSPFGWLIVSVMILVLSLVYRLYRCRTTRWLRLDQLRKRIAADLHDDIGSNLSQLAILSEVLRDQVGDVSPQASQTLNSLARIARESINNMSDIVWTTNPRQDYLSNLAWRMRRFANELLPATNIKFTFQSPAADLEIALNAELRRQVFLIFKEGLNNLVRHSGCTQATIKLQLEGPYLCLLIRDNGIGFEQTHQPAGNGLCSLRQRASQTGGQLDFVTGTAGTTLTFRVRLRMTLWRIYLARYRQGWQRTRKALTSYLNRGVTASSPQHKIPSQPISVRTTKARIGH